jgi:hypothetical protein
MPRLILCILFLLASPILLAAETNWPMWRGPQGDGSSSENIPTKWNGKTAKTLPGRWKSPEQAIARRLSGDRIFVVSCLEDKKEQVLVSPTAKRERSSGSRRCSRSRWKKARSEQLCLRNAGDRWQTGYVTI